jgi:hypothetical protein
MFRCAFSRFSDMSKRTCGVWSPKRPVEAEKRITFCTLVAKGELDGPAWGEPFVRRR